MKSSLPLPTHSRDSGSGPTLYLIDTTGESGVAPDTTFPRICSCPRARHALLRIRIYPRLSGSVVAVDHGEIWSELESLVFRQRVDPAVMKDGDKRDGRAAYRLLRHMLLCSGAMSCCSASPCALLQMSASARMSSSESSPFAQGIALPSRAVLGPLKQFFENSHLRITVGICSPGQGHPPRGRQSSDLCGQVRRGRNAARS